MQSSTVPYMYYSFVVFSGYQLCLYRCMLTNELITLHRINDRLLCLIIFVDPLTACSLTHLENKTEVNEFIFATPKIE